MKMHARHVLCFVVACAGALPAAKPLVAQDDSEYRTIPVNQTLRTNKIENGKHKSIVAKVLRGDESLADKETKKLFDRWFREYIFPRMTQIEPEDVDGPSPLNELPLRREELHQYFWKARSQQEHDYLNGITLWYMSGMCRGNFHPVVRHNAMLVIGDLNAVEAIQSGIKKAAPVPLPAAMDVMLGELEKNEQLDAVRVAAMVGIQRHAQMDQYADLARKIKPETKMKLIGVLTRIINTETPLGRSEKGHQWMRRRAVEIVGELHADGKTVGPMLAEILANSSEPISLRCAAAKALGRINLPPAFATAPSAHAIKLGELAVNACRDEIKRLQEIKAVEEEKQQLRDEAEDALRGPARRRAPIDVGRLLDGVPGDSVDEMEELEPSDPRVDLSRRRLLARLHSVHIGLVGDKDENRARQRGKGGILLMAKAPKDVEVKGIADKVNDLIAICKKPEVELIALMADVGSAGSSLDEEIFLIQGKSAPANTRDSGDPKRAGTVDPRSTEPADDEFDDAAFE